MRSATWSTVLGGALVASLLATGCASPPTADGGAEGEVDATAPAGTEGAGDDAGDGNGGGGLDNSAGLEEVYAAVEGLDPDARRQKLIELAAEEDGLTVYSSTNIDDAEPLLAAFEEMSGIEPTYYRASSSDVLQRILQETDANYPGNDATLLNGPEMSLLDQEGLLLPLESPYKQDIVEAAVFDTWAGVYLNSFVAAWNTDQVTDPPATWEEVLQDPGGPLALELGDFDWFATLTKRYFTEEQGMTEEEVVEMFKEAASGARVVDGHTLMAELLVAGEFGVGTSLYHHRIDEFISQDAPLAYDEPTPVEPIIIRPNGAGIMKGVQNPASALLWTDFLLSDAQQLLAEEFRGPASTKVDGGVPTEYETLLVDLEALLDEREKWEGLWEEIVSTSGSEVMGE